MKIDIHTHTRKCKSGDAPTREVSPERFCEAVLATAVRIIAITNHNVFDLVQYEEIEARMGKDAQVWPGIELDIAENGRGHLLVIVSPSLAKKFAAVASEFTKGFTPDNFTATIDQVLEKFEPLKPLYVAHHKSKLPSLSDSALEKLEKGTKHRACLIKEVTNAISAGIYISHGHASIYGSDIHDWAKYEELSEKLPDLRLPVGSFEQFCLLLAKHPATIDTALNKKTPEELVLQPFEDKSILKIRVFNDVNVIFGPKGTGKSCILDAVAKHYAEKGIEAKVFRPAKDKLESIYDIKGKNLKINLEDYGINYCNDEIEDLRAASEVGVTSLRKYHAHFAAKAASQNSRKILLKDIALEDEGRVKRAFNEFKESAKKVESFLKFLTENSSVKSELTEDEYKQVVKILSALLERLGKREWSSFSGWKEIFLLNSAITLFRDQVELKTGIPGKPTNTGFRRYAMNRIEIELRAAEILRSVDTTIPMIKERVGNLGTGKGELEFRTEFQFHTGNLRDGKLSSFTEVGKTTQQGFVTCVREIHRHVYTDQLFSKIAELDEVEGIEGVDTVLELLLFRRYFAIDGVKYDPSGGEASMVMLQKELGVDKDVYILDEPEMSLGNEYISEIIVPRINELTRACKRVFISTHDANIAVRTLPYSSIYRAHDKGGYRTYVGNPFSNNLVNLDGSGEYLDWKKISMKTLEGGEEAFGERGTIYGND